MILNIELSDRAATMVRRLASRQRSAHNAAFVIRDAVHTLLNTATYVDEPGVGICDVTLDVQGLRFCDMNHPLPATGVQENDIPHSGRIACVSEIVEMLPKADTMSFDELDEGDFVFMAEVDEEEHLERCVVGYVVRSPSALEMDPTGDAYKCVVLDSGSVVDHGPVSLVFVIAQAHASVNK